MQRDAMLNSELRQSHEDKRKEEDEKHRRAVEAFAQVPAIMRAAARSFKETGGPGYAAKNPYDVGFDVEQGGPSPQVSGYAQAGARALMGMPSINLGNMQPPPAAEAPAEVRPPVDPTMGQHSGAPTGAAQYGTPPSASAADLIPPSEAPEVPEQPAATAADIMGPQSAAKLFASFGGQRFEVPQQSEHTPFGADYDAIYEGLLDTGEDPHKAMQIVAAQYKADQGEKGRNARLTDQIDARARAREGEHQFVAGEHAKYNQTADVKTDLARERISAMIAQAAARIGTQNETSADRTINTYMGIAKEAKAAAGAKSDIAGIRPIERIMEELSNPDPVVQKTAIDSMATIAAGGKAPIAVLHALEQPFGLVKTYENKAYQLTHGGMNMPSVNEAFKAAAEKLKAVSKAQRVRDFNAWEHAAGRQSRWYNPAMAPFVEDQRAATLDELGLSEGDVASPVPAQTSDMGLNPGMGAATRPKGVSGKGGHLKPKTPAATGGLPPGAISGTLHGKRGYVLDGQFHATE